MSIPISWFCVHRYSQLTHLAISICITFNLESIPRKIYIGTFSTNPVLKEMFKYLYLLVDKYFRHPSRRTVFFVLQLSVKSKNICYCYNCWLALSNNRRVYSHGYRKHKVYELGYIFSYLSFYPKKPNNKVSSEFLSTAKTWFQIAIILATLCSCIVSILI